MEISKKKNVFLTVIVFLIMFTSESLILAYGGEKLYHIRLIIPMILFFGCIGVFVKKNKHGMVSQNFLPFLAVLSICIITSLIHGSGFGVIISYSSILLFAFFFTLLMDFNTFIGYYRKIMLFTALLSVLLYFAVQFVPAFREGFPTVKLEEVREPYYSLFFANVHSITYDDLFRSYGFYWEPGIFQTYLNLALFFEISLTESKTRDKKFYLKLILLSAAIIFTYSTAGIIAMAVVYIYFILNESKGGKLNLLSLLIIAVLAIIAIRMLFYNEDIFIKTFGKLETRGNSFNSRRGSIIGNLLVFINNPFIGVGYGISTVEMQGYASEYANGQYLHQTNTFTNYFASFGAFAGAYFVYGWYKLAKQCSTGVLKTIIAFLIFILITSSENFLPSLCCTVFLFYGINSNTTKNTRILEDNLGIVRG